ncbi:hypothetical protein Tco_0138481, partial [Tanacetum coccineum]
ETGESLVSGDSAYDIEIRLHLTLSFSSVFTASVTLFTFLGSSVGGRSESGREYDRAISDSLVKSSATSLPTFLSAI